MRVYQHRGASNEAISLGKKHRSVQVDIERFERLLAADVTVGHDQIPGLRLQRDGAAAAVYKAKVHCPAFNKGKRAGLRYIYERLTLSGDQCSVLLTIYLHQEGDKEHDVLNRVRSRFADYSTEDGGRKVLWESDL